MIERVTVGETVYAVSPVEDLKRGDRRLYGYVDHMNPRIEIEAGMDESVQKVAVLHEVLHAILHKSGLLIKDATEERVCVAISHGIYALLKHNPQLVTYLTEGK